MSVPVEIVGRAHAKINVFLRVLGLRDDGYHDLESLVLPISLYDVVTVRDSDRATLAVSGERAGELSARGATNLALTVAKVLAESAGRPTAAARISIEKRIPVAAGLGGGSADAAMTLKALNALWDLALDDARLQEVAASVGSDVPALLAGVPVLAHGRGERIQPVHMAPSTWVIRPFDLQVRTPEAFAWWDTDGSTGPDPGVLLAAAETGNAELLGHAMYNDLQRPVCARHPQIADVITAFHEAGALGAVMTGSGPTVAALARHLGHADRLAEAVPGSIVVSAPPAPPAS